MKKYNTIWILNFFIFFSAIQISAQNLSSKIEGSNNYFEICKIAENHYAKIRNTGIKPESDIKEILQYSKAKTQFTFHYLVLT